MKRFLQVAFLFLLLFQNKTFASHSMGGEVSYRHLGGLRYEVIVKLYRDCRSVPLNSPTCEMQGVGATTSTKTLSLTRVSIKDLSNYCKKSSNPCNPPNSTPTSIIDYGIEEHIFLDTVDFNMSDSAFKKFCIIRFGAGQCCRSGSITTGGAGSNFWVFSTLYICEVSKNSSPVLTSLPNNTLCCNQPLFYNMGAIDSIDMDSLSYEWTDPMTSWAGKVSWGGGRSATSPFSDYWPTGYNKSKGPNPNANPPIGTYLDSETGNIIFTPTDCSEITVASIKVIEWRKDTSGKYKVIGEIRRDLMYSIFQCSANNPPTLSSPYKYEICAGQKLCFTITSDDKQYIPPPPAKANPPDTVSLSWNNGIGRGATFKILDPKARLQSGQFCWTSKEKDANDIPYTFTVTARDNNCPMNGINIKTYSVRVKAKAKITWTKKLIKNGLFEIKCRLDSNFKGTPNLFIEVLDSTMTPMDTSMVFGFLQSGSIRTNKLLDSLQFNKGGKYILHFRINNSPYNCPTDYFDTIKVGAITPFLKIQPSAVQEKWVCINSVQSLSLTLKNAKTPIKFRWSTAKTDTLQNINIKVTKDTTIRVDVYDGAGYRRTATWKFYVYKEPVIKMGKDIFSCKGDSVLLTATVSDFSDTINYKWLFNSKQISNTITAKGLNPGFYVLEVSDNNACQSKRDSMQIINMPVIANAGPDRKVCKGDTVMLRASGLDTTKGSYGKYYWYTGSSKLPKADSGNSIRYKFKTDSSMVLQLVQTIDLLTCYDLDTVAVSFRPLPEIILKNNSICQNETELDLQNVILKPVNSNKGILTWQLIKTLKKPGGNANTLTDLVYDKDPSSNTSYYLKVAESIIDLNGKFKDSIVLGLTYKDEFGCQNVSSNNSNIVVRSNVAVTFIYDELKRCHDDSVTYISNDYGVNYYGGIWFSLNDSSNYLKWPQGHLVQLYEKLGTTSLDKKGGKYRMRYRLENNQCFSSKDAVLTIVPYPTILWTQTDKGDSIILTDKSTNAEKWEWFINSKKKSISNSLTISKQDAKTFNILLKVFNRNCETDSLIKPVIITGMIKSNISNQCVISPNPVQKNLFIKALTNEPYHLEIINNIGQSVLVKIMGNKDETIDVSRFQDGIYNLILKSGKEIFIQKFVKTSD